MQVEPNWHIIRFTTQHRKSGLSKQERKLPTTISDSNRNVIDVKSVYSDPTHEVG